MEIKFGGDQSNAMGGVGEVVVQHEAQACMNIVQRGY